MADYNDYYPPGEERVPERKRICTKIIFFLTAFMIAALCLIPVSGYPTVKAKIISHSGINYNVSYTYNKMQYTGSCTVAFPDRVPPEEAGDGPTDQLYLRVDPEEPERIYSNITTQKILMIIGALLAADITMIIVMEV